MDDENEQIMDDAFIADLNTQPIEHRLLLLEKFFTTAISFCNADEGCQRAHVADKELLKIALSMLNSMANNGGKISERPTPFDYDKSY